MVLTKRWVGGGHGQRDNCGRRSVLVRDGEWIELEVQYANFLLLIEKKNVNIEPQARRSWETVKRRLIACPAGAPAGGAIVEIEKNA